MMQNYFLNPADFGPIRLVYFRLLSNKCFKFMMNNLKNLINVNQKQMNYTNMLTSLL